MARNDEDALTAAQKRAARSGRSFFPAANPRFTGILEPSPTGSYYNPARYAGFHGDIGRVQRSLGTLYQNDLAYNRVLNPGYQPEQDRGYGSEAAVGSGRASPATTRNYLNTYGFDTGGGNIGIYLPSGGFASVSRRGQTLQQYQSTNPFAGGLAAGGNAPFAGQPTAPSPLGSTSPQVTLGQPKITGISYPASEIGQAPETRLAIGPNHQLTTQQFTPNQGPDLGERIRQGAYAFGRSLASNPTGSFLPALNSVANYLGRQQFGGGQQNQVAPNQQSTQSQNFYAYNPSPVPMQPRRYFDPSYNQ